VAEDVGGASQERPGSPAAYASNWKTVLAVDAVCGLAVVVVGFVVMALWNVIVGAFVASGALVYLLLVGRRAMQWRWLRGQAGL
jgi:Flp pilus assembly protein TadB